MEMRTVPIAFAYYATGEKHERMARRSIKSLRSQMPDADIRFIDPSGLPSAFVKFKEKYNGTPSMRTKFGLCSFFRLGIPPMEQFSDCKRVVWMDADTKVVSSEISDLASVDMGGKDIALGQDVVSNRKSRSRYLHSFLHTPVKNTYFSSGVLLFDLERIDPTAWESLLDKMLDAYSKTP